MHRVAKKSELRTNIKNHQNASTCYIYIVHIVYMWLYMFCLIAWIL
jgi:hypothetical protein